MLAIEDVLEILSTPLLGIIPESEEVLRASNSGSPITISNPSSALARAYVDAARRLKGEVVEMTIPSDKKGLFNKLLGRRASQQERMKICNTEAGAKNLAGDTRGTCMSTRLSGRTAVEPAVNSQQQKMKDCNVRAGEQKLTGDARRTFMSSCLKGTGIAGTVLNRSSSFDADRYNQNSLLVCYNLDQRARSHWIHLDASLRRGDFLIA